MAKSTRRRKAKSGTVIQGAFHTLLRAGLRKDFYEAYEQTPGEYVSFIGHMQAVQFYAILAIIEGFLDRLSFTYLIPWI